MKTTDEIKLLPCAHCGSEPVTEIKGNNHTAKRSVIIKCKQCRITLINSGITSPIATLMQWSFEAWNTRSTPDVSSLVEALERVSAISCGEAQVADTDTDAMSIIFECADKALAKFRNLQ